MLHSIFRRKVKKEAFSNFKLSDEVFLVDKKKFSYLNDLKLENTVGIAEDMIQRQLFHSPRFYDTYIRLLSKNFYCG